MRKDVQEFIMADEERRRFIREQPIWYRRLGRNPDELAAFQLAMMNYYEKPFRIGSINLQTAFKWRK